MTFWSLTNSDLPTNQTFHQFHDLYTELDLHRLWVVSMEHLQRVWLASRERLPFRTPGSVPHFGTCWCSNYWDQIPRTCHVFTRPFTSNTPWYFLDFALFLSVPFRSKHFDAFLAFSVLLGNNVHILHIMGTCTTKELFFSYNFCPYFNCP